MKALIAENLLLKQPLFLIIRSRKCAPNLKPLDRLLLGLWTIFLDPRRIKRAALLVQPSTLLRCQQALIKWKYPLLDSSPKSGTRSPKGPSRHPLEPVLEMKRRAPQMGHHKGRADLQDLCHPPRKRCRETEPRLPLSGESLRLTTHWVLVVMDQYPRRVIRLGIHPAPAKDGRVLGRLF